MDGYKLPSKYYLENLATLVCCLIILPMSLQFLRLRFLCYGLSISLKHHPGISSCYLKYLPVITHLWARSYSHSTADHHFFTSLIRSSQASSIFSIEPPLPTRLIQAMIRWWMITLLNARNAELPFTQRWRVAQPVGIICTRKMNNLCQRLPRPKPPPFGPQWERYWWA